MELRKNVDDSVCIYRPYMNEKEKYIPLTVTKYLPARVSILLRYL